MHISRGVPGRNSTIAKHHAIAGYCSGSQRDESRLYLQTRCSPQQAEEARSRARLYVPHAIRIAQAVQNGGYRVKRERRRTNNVSADPTRLTRVSYLIVLIFARYAAPIPA
ncbi:hypothetical protein IEO21_10005 [Rhodonia placenta]|uniref:Uncharacterized protein n=1 Tax=Rhodonia placenta TaxID=104341 RepID=A0A8H7NTD1_9APHY|nr:hypothetical protein IEO21_10005 [Postia placenta]